MFCPNFSGCKTFLTEVNLKDIGLDPEIIEKFNTYSINHAIESMKDYSWCPIQECAQPAELDLVKHFGKCTQCGFVFCLNCKEKYHFFKQCPKVRADYELRKKQEAIREALTNSVSKMSDALN